jgi:hypothetical protein
VFEGFALEHLDLGGVRVRVRPGGDWPPVVLLHGHPRAPCVHGVALDSSILRLSWPISGISPR